MKENETRRDENGQLTFMHTTKSTNNRKGKPFFSRKTIVFKHVGGNIKIVSKSNNTDTTQHNISLLFSLVLVKFV